MAPVGQSSEPALWKQVLTPDKMLPGARGELSMEPGQEENRVVGVVLEAGPRGMLIQTGNDAARDGIRQEGTSIIKCVVIVSNYF